MYFDAADEFPHVAKVLLQKRVPDGSGGSSLKWVPEKEIDCFIDTPSTDRIVEASKLNIIIHRDLYCPYEEVIPATARIEYEGVEYTMSGDSEDQGGMHEINRIPLKRV